MIQGQFYIKFDFKFEIIYSEFSNNDEFKDLNLDLVFDHCKQLEENRLKDHIKKSKYKAERCTNIKYSVDQFKYNSAKNSNDFARKYEQNEHSIVTDSSTDGNISSQTSSSFANTRHNTRKNSRTRINSKRDFINSQSNRSFSNFDTRNNVRNLESSSYNYNNGQASYIGSRYSSQRDTNEKRATNVVFRNPKYFKERR